MNDDLARARDAFGESATAWSRSTHQRKLAEGLSSLKVYLERVDVRLQRMEERLNDLETKPDSESNG